MVPCSVLLRLPASSKTVIQTGNGPVTEVRANLVMVKRAVPGLASSSMVPEEALRPPVPSMSISTREPFLMSPLASVTSNSAL